jgi:predicted SAM-dependent methyltransferase
MKKKILTPWLDLGCGMRKAGGWVGVDIRPYKDVDFVFNVGKDKFPFPDNYFEKIQAIHLFEHLYPEELFHCVDECWRVLKPTGYLHVEVPEAGTPAYYIHPDHKIQFKPNTFSFFQVPAHGNDLHGYLKGYWHVGILTENIPPEAVHVDMWPNKPNGRFDYEEVKKYENI